jgi:dTDP-4-dehydrorhamnose reductase
MLRQAAERYVLRVIGNQLGVPTSVELIADVMPHAIRVTVTNPDLSGTYHLEAGGETMLAWLFAIRDRNRPPGWLVD